MSQSKPAFLALTTTPTTNISGAKGAEKHVLPAAVSSLLLPNAATQQH
jgi:hypothetical protein